MFLLRASFWFTIFTIFRACTCEETRGNIFLYPGKAISERDLETCDEREVCSIVHNRFFYPKRVERFCRCADKECSSTWIDIPDNFTMHVNNRAQMKFCEPIDNLLNCMETNDTTTLYLTVKNTTMAELPNNDSDEIAEDYKIFSKASCYCPPHHKWLCSSIESNSSSRTTVMQFRCAPLPKCNVDEFCGSERSDYYSVYYHCSCPVGHLCVRNNDSQFQAREILYDGSAYKAQCTKFPEIRNHLSNHLI